MRTVGSVPSVVFLKALDRKSTYDRASYNHFVGEPEFLPEEKFEPVY